MERKLIFTLESSRILLRHTKIHNSYNIGDIDIQVRLHQDL
jgi:hypothetical protein